MGHFRGRKLFWETPLADMETQAKSMSWQIVNLIALTRLKGKAHKYE